MYFVYIITLTTLTLHLLEFFNGQVPLFRRTPLDIPLILFLISQTISTIFSIDPHTSFFGYYSRLNGGLLSLLCYSTLYWILIVYLDDQFKEKIVNTSLLAGLVVSIYGILQHFGIDDHIWAQDVVARVFSTLGQPNWLAAYLCILLPLSIEKFLNSKIFIHQSYFIFHTSVLYLCLLFTKSKTGLAAAIISLGIYFLISFFKNKILFRNHKSYLIILLLILLSLTIPNPIKDLIFPVPPVKGENKGVLQNITPSEDIRKIVWTGAINLWKKFPLIGTGPETFAYSYYWTRPAAHNLTSEWDFLYNKAHNEYLNYLATTGLFGLITYLVLIVLILKLLFTDYRLLISFLSILITNATGFSVVITSIYFFLLPTLSISPVTHQSTTKKSFIYKLALILFFFYFSSKILFYYLADITYSQSEKYDTAKLLQLAYNQIKLSLGYRLNEPIYLSQAATIASELALTTKDSQYVSAAISYSDAATSLSPANTNLLKQRAQVFYYLSAIDSKYLATAIDTLVKTATLAPTDARTFFLLGQFFESGGQTAESIKFYQQATILKPNYDHAYFALGRLYFNAKDYPSAKTAFTKVLELAPTNSDAKEFLNKIPN